MERLAALEESKSKSEAEIANLKKVTFNQEKKINELIG
jgi:hypothetical protein